MIGCDFCHCRHGDLYLCPPARQILEAVRQQAANAVGTETRFPELVPTPGADYTLVRSLTVEAVLAPVGETRWPGIVLGGQDWAGTPRPRLLLPGSAGDLRQTCRLMQSQTEKAIRKARE